MKNQQETSKKDHEEVLQLKVLLVNGSPHAKGCTFTALSEVAEALKANGIDTEIMHLGTGPISGCLACGRCLKKR